MYRYDAIREVHVELTTRCNASCPQCPRTASGGDVNPALPMAELSLDDVKTLFPRPFLRQLRKLYACGNYGDPMVAADALGIFEHLRSENEHLVLGMFTNGSGRTPSFWRALAKVVTYVRFSIDGLEDTNHLYRQRTEWSRIMDSARAFIEAGGRAEWDFIVFRHNEHQVEQAREFAAQLGFQRFFVKRTSRFWSGTTSKPKQVYARGGAPLHVLEEPSDVRFRNDEVIELARLSRTEALRAYQANTPIECKAVAHSRLYVSAEGFVFPCCWTGALYPPGRPPGSARIWTLLHRLPGGPSSLDGRRRTIERIVNGAFFQDLVPRGWEPGRLEDGRLEPCVRSCGSHDMHSAQYGPSLL